MIAEKATYSRRALEECVDKVKALNSTVQKRNQHFALMNEVHAAYDFCLEKTGCILFEYEYTPCQEYVRCYDTKPSKIVMDKLLKQSVNYLKWELNGIATMMASGEVNVVD